MKSVKCDPSNDRQISPGGPWIIWRPSPTGTGRQGLAVAVSTCANIECPCTEAGLSGVIITDRARSVAVTDKVFRVTYARGVAPPNPSEEVTVSVRVDFTTAEMSDEVTSGDDGESVLKWLRSLVDGELLELVHAHWLRQRGMDPDAVQPAPSAWRLESGDLMAWAEAFWGRPDIYLLRGMKYMLVDRYCIDPACECREVGVSFLRCEKPAGPNEFVAQGKWKHVGLMQVEVPSCEVVVRDPTDASELTLNELWDAVCRRYRDAGAHFARRYDRMKTYGGEVLPREAVRTTITSSPKVGRNEPCPCGSGKKFKRCCGPA
ncbi:MAG: SEC-C metal-binding domain-containing protein [Planctomycetota bacterium]